jgi:large conductance mechanosensitive channel
MLQDFKQFLFRGNVVDLAVAVVIGAAFGAVVTAFVTGVLTPLIAAFVGTPNFESLIVTIGESEILYGTFLNALVSFLLVGAAVYFFVVLPMKAMLARGKREAPSAAPQTKSCPECLSEIPAAARRCAYCASVVAAGAKIG